MGFPHCPSGKRHCAIGRKGGMRCRHLLPLCFLRGFPPDIEYPLSQTGQLFHWVCHKVDILLYEGTFPHQLQGKILFLSLEKERINAKFFCCVVSFWIRSYCYCTSNVQNESLYFKNYFWSLVWAHRNVYAVLYSQLYPLFFWWHSCLVVSWWDTLHTLTLWDDIKYKAVTSMLLGIEGCPQDHIFSFLPHICNQSLFKGILLLFKGKWYLESSILTLLLGVVSRSPGRWHIPLHACVWSLLTVFLFPV